MRKLMRVIIILVLMFTTIGSVAPYPGAATAKIHPFLADLAARAPHQIVSVIVQKTGKSAQAEILTQKLGGKVTKDLYIINAFAAEMSAAAAQELAASPAVRWVSPDAPVRQSSDEAVFITWASEAKTPTFGDITATSSVGSGFNGVPILAGSTIWFSAVFNASGLPNNKVVNLRFDNASIEFTADGVYYKLDVPNMAIIYDPAAANVTTSFDTTNNTWITTAKSGLTGNVFLGALAYPVPVDLPGGITPVTWSGRFSSDTPGVNGNWKWAASVYSNFNSDYNALGVKPCNILCDSRYRNLDNAGTPEIYKSYNIGGARSGRRLNYTGYYSALTKAFSPIGSFTNVSGILDSQNGPNGTYAYGGYAKAAFAGFVAEQTPGYAISKVEVLLQAYVPAIPSAGPKLTIAAAGVPGNSVELDPHVFDNLIGPENTGLVVVDVTSTRTWKWSDFDPNLEITIDQSNLSASDTIYYDAIGLLVTSLPGQDTSEPAPATMLAETSAPIDISQMDNVYNQVIGSSRLWNQKPFTTLGSSRKATIAVVDSGIAKTKDLIRRVRLNVNFNKSYHESVDLYGHGTFVADIIAGNGITSGGKYIGVAPRATLINVRVSDDQGMTTESDVIEGLQWIYANKDRTNIRVVNLSLNSSVEQSYHNSPLCAVVEILWFNGIVVVVSAGNSGTADLYPPANDPFVITVGATDDMGTETLRDDVIASYSAYGVTENGLIKPELVAPGSHIIGLLPNNENLTISNKHPDHRINVTYFRMSGTSMSAPMVSGSVAMLLQAEPKLTPDQVKYRLMATANQNWPGYDANKAGAGYLDIYAAVYGKTTESANMDIPTSQLLWSAIDQPLVWNSAAWNSAAWNSAAWNSAAWNSAAWNSAAWNSAAWNSAAWNSAAWNSAAWNSLAYNSDYWDP